MAGLFQDEATPPAYLILPQQTEEPAAAPMIWPLEIANALRIAERRVRITPEQTRRFLDELLGQPIDVESDVPDIDALLTLARRHDLTVYDAAYLELALRLDRPLATLDRRLAAAARAEGVPVIA